MAYTGVSPGLAVVNPIVDIFTGGVDFTAGSSTQLTLSSTPPSENVLVVTMDGVTQHHDTYSVAGATLTFDAAIPSGVTKIEVHFTVTTARSEPADASVTTAKIADSNVTTAKIADSNVTTAKIADSNVTTAKIANNAVTAAKVSSDVAQLGKNLLINGGMHVAQRGDQTGQGGGTAYTALDRWENRWAAGTEQARFTTSRDSLSVANTVLAGGVRHALLIDCTTAETAVAAGEMEIIVQKIEGQHLQHLQFGNAAAKTLSISFGISSPKSGTHCVALYSPDGNRGYIAEFTVAAADTFEVIKIEGIPGDTAGTINNDTGEGMRIAFPLICGSTLQDSAGAWFTGEKYATSNQQNLLDNTANNIWITRVQLEVGSVATDFEHEDYGTTLAKCLRYYWRKDMTNPRHFTGGYETSSGNGVSPPYNFPQVMRVAPTITWNGTYQLVENGSVVDTTITVTSVYSEVSTACMNVISGSIVNGGYYGVTRLSGTCNVEHSAEL